MKKAIIANLIALVLIAGPAMPAFAQNPAQASRQELIAKLQEQIQLLHARVEQLKKDREAVRDASGNVGQTLKLLGDISEGMTGADVTLLQTILAADAAIYPEGQITGYYGKLTTKAVKRFQQKHGLKEAGKIGKGTLKKLNKDLDETPIATEDRDNDGKKEHCAIVPPGHLIAPGWLRKHNRVRPIVPPCQILPPGILKKLRGTTTPPTGDILPPTILSLATGSTTPTTTTVSWTTNEPAKGKIYYSTTTPVVASSSISVFDETLLTIHATMLSGLAPNTAYTFILVVMDSAGNRASSTPQSFTTPALPDTTAPVISAVLASSTASTSATISWTTNEAATSKVYYGTTSPLVLAGAATVSTTSLVLTHALTPTGLSASTTYYFIVESRDAAGNTATSSQQSFSTPS